MASMEDRVTSMEQRVTHLEADCRRGGETADAAMAAHRHNTTLIMALRETQLEHGQRLDGIDAKLAEHGRRFDEVDRRFDEVDRRFDGIDAKLDSIDREIASMKGTIGRVAVGMSTLEKLIRRIAPDEGQEASN